jgi:EAL domain-containing protein (putative c-di-GMP-specific phosphodiesterase class I)
VLAFEALLRWTHPRLGRISPQDFVPLAEESGAIIPIGAWVMAEASRQLAAWRQSAGRPDLVMGVNLSVLELRDPEVVARTLAAVERAGVDPAGICLEVTENRSLSASAVEQVRRLRLAGFRIALDDFGTLQSNFDRLRQFPVDHVKIDRSFVAGLGTDPVDQAAVRATMVIGEALALDVVAEGVETEEQRAELIRSGCKMGQGYLFSPPLPPEAALALLARTAPMAAASR